MIAPINQAHKLDCAKTFAFREARILSRKHGSFPDKMVNILGVNQLNAHFNYMSRYSRFFDGFARYVEFEKR